MSVSLLNGLIQEFFINGIPATGAKLFCYAAGTTTKQNTYTDSTGSTLQTNPIILNARGEPQNTSGASVGIWLTSSLPYKFVLAPSMDTDPPTSPIWTIDNVYTGQLSGVSYSATGTNAISLTPLTGTPTITAYANYQQYVFVAPNTNTGLTTLQVGSLGFLPLYINGVQATANTITAGVLITAYYNSALNSGAGGFVGVLSNGTSNYYTGYDYGSVNGYALNTPTPVMLSYQTGQLVAFLANNSNTGASTLNVNYLGAKNIKVVGPSGLFQPLSANQITNTGTYLFLYDGTEFILLNPNPYYDPVSANDSGTANAYVLTTFPYVTTPIGNLPISFFASNTNTGASTVAINGGSAIAIKRSDGSLLLPRDITSGQWVTIVYNGTNFTLQNTSTPSMRIVAKASFAATGGTLSTVFNNGFSSITRTAQGKYALTFNTNLVPDANYAVSAIQTSDQELFVLVISKSSTGFSLFLESTTATYVDGNLDVIVVY